MVGDRSSVRCTAVGWKRATVAAVAWIAPLVACGTPPTGDPATGVGGGGNMTCGHSSFPSNATLYQDISAAAVDSESPAIMGALDARNWGDPGDRQALGIDFSFEVNCAAPSVARRVYAQDGDHQPDCDLAAIPVPSGGKTEGAGDYACSGGDCHLIVYQGTRLYELYQANITTGAAVGGRFTGA